MVRAWLHLGESREGRDDLRLQIGRWRGLKIENEVARCLCRAHLLWPPRGKGVGRGLHCPGVQRLCAVCWAWGSLNWEDGCSTGKVFSGLRRMLEDSGAGSMGPLCRAGRSPGAEMRYSGSASGAGDGAAQQLMRTWAPTRLWRLLYEPGAWQRARRARRAQRWTWFRGQCHIRPERRR
eukprot:scaffold395_cov133-Isochrysis_galbana.AAC.3